MKTLKTLAVLILLLVPALVCAQDWKDIWLTPETLVKKIDIRDADSIANRHDIILAYLSEDLFFKNRHITLKGSIDWGSGIRIDTIPAVEDKLLESKWPSTVEYEVKLESGFLGVWREVENKKQHIWFVFKLQLAMPTDKLIAFLEDIRKNPVREYEGYIDTKLSVRTDKNGIPMEDFEVGAKTIYVEILIHVVKVDGKELK